MLRAEDFFFEELAYAAPTAYREVTGEELPQPAAKSLSQLVREQLRANRLYAEGHASPPDLPRLTALLGGDRRSDGIRD